jgi:hypothetical protein
MSERAKGMKRKDEEELWEERGDEQASWIYTQ